MYHKFDKWKDHLIKDNSDSILIYEKLFESFNKCNSISAPYLNLVSIFFHDLIRIISSLALISNEIRGPYVPDDYTHRAALTKFPYIGLNDFKNGINADNKKFKTTSISQSNNITELLKKNISLYKRLFQYEANKSINYLFKKKEIWLVPYFLNEDILKSDYLLKTTPIHKCPIPNMKNQLNVILHAVKDICDTLELNEYSESLANLISLHIKSNSADKDPNKLNFELAITGTQLALEYRFMAALGRYSNIPVFSIAHGEVEGVYDEPWIGYGEKSLPTHYFGYGKIENNILEKQRFTKTFYDTPKYIPSNSDNVNKCFKNSKVNTLTKEDLLKKKITYVPSQLYGNYRWGPFHMAPDMFYKKWQTALFDYFPNMIFKKHPKVFIPFIPNNVKYIESGVLENKINNTDIFIFDIFSGAMANAIATQKPIIYFNIGLRNLTKTSEEYLRSRCIWIDVDTNTKFNLNELVHDKLPAERNNHFSEKFSLGLESNQIIPRKTYIAKFVKKII